METNSIGKAGNLGTMTKEDLIEDYRMVGKLSGGYSIYREKGYDNYMVTYPHKHQKKVHFVAELQLSKIGSYHQVDYVSVSRLFKGQNIAFRLYRFLMMKRKMRMMGGTSQSPGARKLWAKLARSRVLSVYAKYNTNRRAIYPVKGTRTTPILDRRSEDLYDDSNLQLFAKAV